MTTETISATTEQKVQALFNQMAAVVAGHEGAIVMQALVVLTASTAAVLADDRAKAGVILNALHKQNTQLMLADFDAIRSRATPVGKVDLQ